MQHQIGIVCKRMCKLNSENSVYSVSKNRRYWNSARLPCMAITFATNNLTTEVRRQLEAKYPLRDFQPRTKGAVQQVSTPNVGMFTAITVDRQQCSSYSNSNSPRAWRDFLQISNISSIMSRLRSKTRKDFRQSDQKGKNLLFSTFDSFLSFW